MMRGRLFAFYGGLLVFISSILSCDKEERLPDCVQLEIQKIISEQVRNPPSSVVRYTYNNQLVYFIPAYCCDFPSVLLNSNCDRICSPDGGISGSGDDNCADFFQKRTEEQIIWQDNR
jgi:hypothetical protein